MSRWAWLSKPLHNSQRSTIRGFHRGPYRHMDKRHLVAKRINPDKRWRGRPKPKPWSGLNFVNKFNHVATVSRFQVTVKTRWLGQCGAGSLSILWTSWSGRQYAVPELLYCTLDLPWIALIPQAMFHVTSQTPVREWLPYCQALNNLSNIGIQW